MPETRAGHDANITLRTATRHSPRKRTAAVLELDDPSVAVVDSVEHAQLPAVEPATSFSAQLSSFAYKSSSRPSNKKRSIATHLASSESGEIGSSVAAVVADHSENNGPNKRSISAQKMAGPRKKKTIQMALETPHPVPNNWEEVYGLIKEMRQSMQAPVDVMGCDASMKEVGDPRTKRFSTLISLMLSSQTKDEVTHAAVRSLSEALGGLTVDNILSATNATIEAAICKVGFWRRKTQYVRQTAQKLKDEFDSDVPKTVDELCSLPGVGPKMAFLALQSAWNLNHGIGVDVHVHRITNRLGWHKPPTTNPEQTRLNLQSWLPSELHREINPLLVGFGQVICLPVNPRCEVCKLSDRHLCPSARVTRRKNTVGTASSSKERGVLLSPAISAQDRGESEYALVHADYMPKIEIEIEPSGGLVKIEK